MLALGQEPGTHLHHPTRPSISLALADTARVVTKYLPFKYRSTELYQATRTPARRELITTADRLPIARHVRRGANVRAAAYHRAGKNRHALGATCIAAPRARIAARGRALVSSVSPCNSVRHSGTPSQSWRSLSHLSHLGLRGIMRGIMRARQSPMNRGVTCEIASIYGEFARAARFVALGPVFGARVQHCRGFVQGFRPRPPKRTGEARCPPWEKWKPVLTCLTWACRGADQSGDRGLCCVGAATRARAGGVRQVGAPDAQPTAL